MKPRKFSLIKVVVFSLFFTMTMNSCSQDILLLENDKVVRKVFNSEEIKELKNLLNIYDNTLKENFETENTIIAYHKFLETLKYKDANDIYNELNILQPATDSAMTYLMNGKTYEKSFKINYGYRKNSNFKDTLSSMFYPLENGKYFGFLKELVKKEKILVDYLNAIEASGTIPPSTLIAFSFIYENFNLEKERNRLAIVFHYLVLLSHKDYKTNKA